MAGEEKGMRTFRCAFVNMLDAVLIAEIFHIPLALGSRLYINIKFLMVDRFFSGFSGFSTRSRSLSEHCYREIVFESKIGTPSPSSYLQTSQ